jgi:hypothetical protein
MKIDQRAWVEVVSPITTGIRSTVDHIEFGAVTATMRNTGKTPGVKVAWVCCMFVTGNVLGPFPDYDTMIADWAKRAEELKRKREKEMEMDPFFKSHPELREREKQMEAEMDTARASTIHDGGVVAPDAAFSITLSGPIIVNKANTSRPPLPIAQFILGKVTYDDVFHERRHTTRFCIMETESGLSVCPEGNWMD